MTAKNPFLLLVFSALFGSANAGEFPTFAVVRIGPGVNYYSICPSAVNNLTPGASDISVLNIRTCEANDYQETPGPPWAAPGAPTYGRVLLPGGDVLAGCALVESRVLTTGSGAAQFVTVECPGNAVFNDGFYAAD